ncbi:Kelch repeat-containing protein [Nocardioides sp.]|uniref:Kelch repeat-containing protein n=1 Tax=Nocardioides sp. TaxID=35761 RepID=UPI00356A9979
MSGRARSAVPVVASILLLVATLLAGCSSAGAPRAEEPGDAPATAPTDTDRQWRQVAGRATARDDFASVVVDDQVWVLGGMTGDRGNRLDSIEVYDPARDRWRTVRTRVPEPLAAFEAVAVGPRIFAFGGLDERSRPSHFAAVLDTRTGTWTRLPRLPHARYAHSVTLHEGRIYVFGGLSGVRAVARTDVYDPATSTWSRASAMPRARGSHDAVAVQGEIYVLGGWLDSAPTRLVQVYDPETDRWRRGPALPEEVSRAGATALGDQLWVAHHEFTAVLTVGGREWRRAAPMTESRHGLSLVGVGGLIYGIGGCTESPLQDVDTVDVLDPARAA